MGTKREKSGSGRYELIRRVLADNLRTALNGHPIFRGEEQALAKESGIGKSTVNRILHAKTNLTIDSLVDLAYALNIYPHSLLEPFIELQPPAKPKEYRPEDTTIIQKAPTFPEAPRLHSKKIEDAAASYGARRGLRHSRNIKKG